MPLLDLVPPPVLAVSKRLLATAYTDPLAKIRNAANDSVLDIGFDGGGLWNAAAEATFLGSETGTVDTWYDQSGVGNHLVNAETTQQPTSTDAGVPVVTDYGPPCFRFDSAQALSATLTTPITGTTMTICAVISMESATAYYGRLLSMHELAQPDDYSTDASTAGILRQATSDVLEAYRNFVELGTQTVVAGAVCQVTSLFSDTQHIMRVNFRPGSPVANAATFNIEVVLLGTSWFEGGLGAEWWNGKAGEIIVWDSSLDLINLAIVEADQALFWTGLTPPSTNNKKRFALVGVG